MKRWNVERVIPRSGAYGSVAFSPDDRLIAYGTRAGQVRIYDAETMQLVRIFAGHTGDVYSVAWSPDGKRLVSCGNDPTIRIWNRDGTVGPVIRKGGSYAVAWSPDGRWIAADNGAIIQLWSPDGTRGPKLGGHKGSIVSLAWSPDGSWLAAADTVDVRLWKPDGTAGPILEDVAHDQLAWSPDGEWLASSGRDYTIQLSRVDGTPGAVLDPPENTSIYGLSWSPDGNTLAAASVNVIHLWDPDGTLKRSIKAGGNNFSVQWNAAGDRLAAVGDYPGIRVWNADGTPHHIPKGIDGSSVLARWSPDGRQLATSHARTVWLWEADGSDRTIIELDYPPGPLAWSPDGTKFVTAGGATVFNSDGTVATPLRGTMEGKGAGAWCVTWSPDGQWITKGYHATGDISLWNADAEDAYYTALAWSPDGEWLASGEYEKINLWKPDGTAGPVLDTKGNTDLAWSPNGEQLASASSDGAVRLWEKDGTPGPVLEGHSTGVEAVAWSPDGEWLASAGGDIRLWKPDGTPGAVMEQPDNYPPRTLAWSPGGQTLASAYVNRIHFWNSQGKQARPSLYAHGSSHIYSVHWTDDGSLIGANGVGYFAIWSIDDADGRQPWVVKQLMVPRTHKDPVVRWSPSEDRMAFGDVKSVWIWNGDGTENVPIELEHHPDDLAWSPDGSQLVTASGHKPYLWNKDGTLGPVLRGFEAGIGHTVAWSPDGQWIVKGQYETIRLWKSDGTRGPECDQNEEYVHSLAWHPDSQQFVTGCAHLHLWNKDGTLAKTFNTEPGQFGAVAWSPDGRYLAALADSSQRMEWNKTRTFTAIRPAWLGILPASFWQ